MATYKACACGSRRRAPLRRKRPAVHKRATLVPTRRPAPPPPRRRLPFCCSLSLSRALQTPPRRAGATATRRSGRGRAARGARGEGLSWGYPRGHSTLHAAHPTPHSTLPFPPHVTHRDHWEGLARGAALWGGWSAALGCRARAGRLPETCTSLFPRDAAFGARVSTAPGCPGEDWRARTRGSARAARAA